MKKSVIVLGALLSLGLILPSCGQAEEKKVEKEVVETVEETMPEEIVEAAPIVEEEAKKAAKTKKPAVETVSKKDGALAGKGTAIQPKQIEIKNVKGIETNTQKVEAVEGGVKPTKR